MSKHKVTVLAPNLQFLENVLPIVYHSRRQESDVEFILVFAAEHTLVTAGINHPLVKFASQFFDEIWVPVSGVYFKTSANHKGDMATFLSKSSKLTRATHRIRLKRKLQSANQIIPTQDMRALLVDYTELRDSLYLKMIEKFNVARIVAITHGEPHPYTISPTKLSAEHPIHELSRKIPNIFVKVFHSDYLRTDMPSSIPHSSNLLQKPPRLDPAWIQFVLNSDPQTQEFSESKQGLGLFFSRPSMSNKQRRSHKFSLSPRPSAKVKVLEEVRLLINEAGLVPVFIKHPHESLSGLDLEGWERLEGKHIFQLLARARIAFSFGSSLVADCNEFGLEMIDYRPDFTMDDRLAWRQNRNLAITSYELNAAFHTLIKNTKVPLTKTETELGISDLAEILNSL